MWTQNVLLSWNKKPDYINQTQLSSMEKVQQNVIYIAKYQNSHGKNYCLLKATLKDIPWDFFNAGVQVH